MLGYKNISVQSPHNPLIIFDFDGVICDSFLLFIKLINSLADKHRLKKIDLENINSYKNMSSDEFIKAVGLSSKLKLYRVISQMKKQTAKAILDLNYFQGIDIFLEDLSKREVNIGMLTSNTKQNANKFLNHYNLNYFDFILSSSNVFGKHVLLNKMNKITNVNKDQIYYVGDETRDIVACQKANIKSIAVSWGFNSKDLLLKTEPTFLVDTIQELKNTIIAETTC